MTRTSRQLVLGFLALASAASFVMIVANPDLLRDPPAPRDPAGMARWLASHPADWRTASLISETALDSGSPNRIALWRSAYAHAKRLAPPLTATDVAFVRGGLFHWYELAPPDRALVLRTAAPLMRDPSFFEVMHVALWQLTADLGWLRSVAPDTLIARRMLGSLALTRGLFADYRTLREDIQRATLRTFETQRETADPTALLAFLPEHIEKADEPLVRGILIELDRRPFAADQLNDRMEALVAYAVTHGIQPLAGVRPLLGSRTPLLRDVTRARAALALDDATLATRIELTAAVAGATEWDPYYIDRARFAARRGDGVAAEGYILRASLGGRTVPVLAGGEEVAKILNRDAAEYRSELVALAGQPRVWLGVCGQNELCTSASTIEYAMDGNVTLDLSMTQSDAIAPYVEVYIDDARVAEGEVREARRFEVPVTPGLHQIEVRLVNARTRNGIQRRVRLS
jgi:hypothetical protein